MTSPKQLIQKIIRPIYCIMKKTISREARHNGYQGIANFIFEHSNETAIIMLVFNSISILASHFAQIRGLKKSKRENKDYLVSQEKKELGLDLVFTIIPPFIINRALMKKLDSGQWTTKTARDKLLNEIAERQPLNTKFELYNTDHIVPVKQTVSNLNNAIMKRISRIEKLPLKTKEFLKGKIKEIPINIKAPITSTEEMLVDADATGKFEKLKGFYNNSVYDDVQGSRNGMLIMATLGYTILTSAILTPILKNILANYSYEKELKRRGETRESIKRKQLYSNLYHEYSKFDNFQTKILTPSKPNNLNADIFRDFRLVHDNPYNKLGIKI
ncbi:hypothetical protein II906_03055 [bacterium]|nr:hypothetical protein [bacterium]